MINTAALLAWLAANWLPLVGAAAAAFIGYDNWDKIKPHLPTWLGGGTAAEDGTGGDILDKLQNLPIVKQLEITASDIKRTGRAGLLIKIGDWVEEIPEAAEKEKCRAAYSTLFNAIVVGSGPASAPAK